MECHLLFAAFSVLLSSGGLRNVRGHGDRVREDHLYGRYGTLENRQHGR